MNKTIYIKEPSATNLKSNYVKVPAERVDNSAYFVTARNLRNSGIDKFKNVKNSVIFERSTGISITHVLGKWHSKANLIAIYNSELKVKTVEILKTPYIKKLAKELSDFIQSQNEQN